VLRSPWPGLSGLARRSDTNLPGRFRNHYHLDSLREPGADCPPRHSYIEHASFRHRRTLFARVRHSRGCITEPDPCFSTTSQLGYFLYGLASLLPFVIVIQGFTAGKSTDESVILLSQPFASKKMPDSGLSCWSSTQASCCSHRSCTSTGYW